MRGLERLLQSAGGPRGSAPRGRGAFFTALCVVAVALIALLDAATGYEFSFAIFYLVPIMAAAFSSGRGAGIVTALLSGVGWFFADAYAEHPYRYPLAIYWNAGVRLAIFLLVAAILARLREILALEQAQRERLAELNNLKNQFIGIAAHDLRTPLAVVQMYAQLLRDRADLPAERRAELLRVILAKSDFMLNMVATILDMSAIESGGLTVRGTCQDYLGFVTEHLRVLGALAEKRGVELRLEPGEAVPPLSFDRDKVEQVLDNLVVNALKFSPAGTAITVSVGAGDGRVVTRVADQGPGIRPEDLPQIFAPFGRAAAGLASAEKGAGLGLTIVKKIVEAHGGEVAVTSAPGQGAVFSFSLPLDRC